MAETTVGLLVNRSDSEEVKKRKRKASREIVHKIWDKFRKEKGIKKRHSTSTGKEPKASKQDKIQLLLEQKEAARGDKVLSRKIRGKLRRLGFKKTKKGKKEFLDVPWREEEPEMESTTASMKRIKREKKKKRRAEKKQVKEVVKKEKPKKKKRGKRK